MKIYHNPKCSKSRQTLKILQDKQIEPQIIEYLKNPPTKNELTQILKWLGISAKQLIRTKEDLFKEKYQHLKLNESEWLDVLIENPELMERPIVIHDNKAVLGRPPENVLNLIR